MSAGVTTLSLMVIWVKNVQAELMVDIYFKTLVRAISNVLLFKPS